MQDEVGARAHPGVRLRYTGLRPVSPADFRDYAFVPGSTAFDQTYRELLQRRPQTILINDPLIDSIADFISDLGRRPLTTNPIRHLIIASHANPEGRLQIRLDVATANATYEDLETVSPPPAGTGSIRVPARILNPRPRNGSGRTIPASLHVKGCRIGRTIPFLRKLKEAVGGGLEVTAPKHFHAAANQTRPAGRVEYMLYGFTINRPNAFRNRAQLISEFAAQGFTLIDGSRIRRRQWDAWIPRAWNVTTRMRPRVINPVTGTVTRTRGEFRYHRRTLLSRRGSIGLRTDPGTYARRRQAVQDAMVLAHARYRASHPFPEYVRFGYRSMAEFMDGWTWDFSWRARDNTLFYQATRYEYTVVQPIVDPATNRLFLNFYPTSSTRTPLIQLQENDARFFATI